MWLSPLSSPNGVWRVPNMLPSPMLPLLHLHHIWSSTSGPHLYSVVSKLGSLDALGGINTRTQCRFKSAQSHEVDPEETTDWSRNSGLWKKQFHFHTKKQLSLYFFFFFNSQIFHWVQIKTGRNWTQSLRELLSKVLRGESISILLVIQNQSSSKYRKRKYTYTA